MAKEVGAKKRKASVPEQDATKLKKPKNINSETTAVPVKKRKATEDAASVTIKKSKTPKSKSTSEHAVRPAEKEHTSQKSGDKTNGVGLKVRDKRIVEKKINGPKDKPAADVEFPKPIDEEEDDGAMADEENEASDIDDQTEALLKGFESDSDEKYDNQEGGLEEGQPIPVLPTLSNKSKKALKRVLESEIQENPGVVYVGRIPHGFYENEMREYFKQFGNILKLRLSRNPKNGASRHYAFIQFESAAVADIVARTMDGYLLFNHILKVKIVPDEQVHNDLFKGANKRFKKVPWNKIRGRELDMGASEASWQKRIDKEEKRRDDKAKKAKEIGYEFEAPKIKAAKNIAKKPTEQLALTENGEVETKAIEAAPAIDESSKSKTKKVKKVKAGEEPSDVIKEILGGAQAVDSSANLKKEKKSKKTKEVETTVHTTAPVVDEPSEPKAKAVKSTDTPTNSATDIPEKKPKTKKSKAALTTLAEKVMADGGTGDQKNKSKKSKKVKVDA